MKQQRNVILILWIGLFVSIGNAQMKDMNHEHQSDSTHQMKMQDHDSMKMNEHESMEMKDHDSIKMQGHDSMKMKQGMKKDRVAEEIVYYTCPMESHKHIHSTEPGECPECGMNLIKAVIVTDEKEADYYGCPMPSHSHVRSEKPGECDQCGMMLKPMKLKKS